MMGQAIRLRRTGAVAGITVGLMLAVVAACGGTAAPSFEQSPSTQPLGDFSKARTFSGSLAAGGSAPAAIRWIHLDAGEALRGYVIAAGRVKVTYCKSPSDSPCVTETVPRSQTERLTATVSADTATYSSWSTLSDGSTVSQWYTQQGSEDDFFSDNERPANGAGVLLESSGWTVDPDAQVDAAGRFWVRGYPSFDGPGPSWFMFIAPADGTYGIVVGGEQQSLPEACPNSWKQCSVTSDLGTDPSNAENQAVDFAIALQSHSLSTGELESIRATGASEHLSDRADDPSSPFPYFGAAWVGIVQQQLPWLFESGFFPSGVFTHGCNPDKGNCGEIFRNGRTIHPVYVYAPTTKLQDDLESETQNALTDLRNYLSEHPYPSAGG